MVLINWLIDRAELALSVYFRICELTLYMPCNVGLSTAIAIVSFSYDHCSFKLVLTTMMIINIYGTKQLRNIAID